MAVPILCRSGVLAYVKYNVYVDNNVGGDFKYR